MKKAFFLFTMVAVLLACKNKKNAAPDETPDSEAKTNGVVSHDQKSGGCSAVIKVDGNEELVLIPKDALGSFDVDGLKISFNYHALKMPQREGCTGLMAEITNITKR